MKALSLAVLFAAATLLLGCSDALPTGPAPAPASQGAVSVVPRENNYLPFSGQIGVRVGNPRDGWYAIEGTVEYSWVDKPAMSPLAMELRIRTEAKMSCVSYPQRTAHVMATTTDVIDIQKSGDPIVKRFHVQSVFESFDLVLMLRSRDGELSILDMWLERTTGGERISGNG